MKGREACRSSARGIGSERIGEERRAGRRARLHLPPDGAGRVLGFAEQVRVARRLSFGEAGQQEGLIH